MVFVRSMFLIPVRYVGTGPPEKWKLLHHSIIAAHNKNVTTGREWLNTRPETSLQEQPALVIDLIASTVQRPLTGKASGTEQPRSRVNTSDRSKPPVSDPKYLVLGESMWIKYSLPLMMDNEGTQYSEGTARVASPKNAGPRCLNHCYRGNLLSHHRLLNLSVGQILASL